MSPTPRRCPTRRSCGFVRSPSTAARSSTCRSCPPGRSPAGTSPGSSNGPPPTAAGRRGNPGGRPGRGRRLGPVRGDLDRRLAPIPDGVSDAQAATLPTAGMTALRALEVAGLLLGKRVLITGATGGVGRMAVQLAPRAAPTSPRSSATPAAAQELLRRLGAARRRRADHRRLRLDPRRGRRCHVRPRHRARRPRVASW